MKQRPPYFSISLLSASTLAYEILLMRLFSIIQWHHFAYMNIGLALLGYGISGTIVSIVQHKLLASFQWVFITCLLLFGLSSVGSFAAAQAIPFNAESILWDSRQIFYLLSIFLLLTIPFFFAASGICLALMRFGKHVSRIYAMDLIGAGIGSLGVVFLLFITFPQSALVIIGLGGFAAVIIASWECQTKHRLWLTIGMLIVITMLCIAGKSLQLTISPYKSLTQTLRISGTTIIEEQSSPLGLLSVVESKGIPLRHAPGLSLHASQEPLTQLGLFTDGDNMTVITQYPDKREDLAYLDQMTSALPYHLKKPEQVLIIGAGGGADILQAQYHNSGHIDAVELNAQIIDLVNDHYSEFSGELYRQENINIAVSEGRGFLTGRSRAYDLIQLALIDSFTASASGLYALHESYLYTTEALQLYLKRLNTDGFLAITRWIKIPPRDTLKLFATAIDALNISGVVSPETQLVLIRSWQTSTLLIKKGKFTKRELDAIQAFCDSRAFDIAYSPTISRSQVNRYNVLREPFFYRAAVSLLSEERDVFLEQYKFHLEPARDDKPYFHHFFKWSSLSEIFQLRGKGGMPLIEWGYMVLLTTLLIAAAMSVVLILSPLWFFRKRDDILQSSIKKTHVAIYFFAIGLAFLFVEIAFIQRFILFLHHPIYSIAVTLTAFLVFAGLGSSWSMKLSERKPNRKGIMIALFGIFFFSLTYLFILQPLFSFLVALPISLKIVPTILLIAPLAFFMGMPFPLAITSLSRYAQPFIPWAWGINGCASVMSAVLATLLAIHFGFTTVILCALLLYGAALFVFPFPRSR